MVILRRPEAETVHGEASVEFVRSLLLSALDACSEPIEIADLEGRILFVNDSWRNLFSMSGQETKGYTWDSLTLGARHGTRRPAAVPPHEPQDDTAGHLSVSGPHGSSRRVDYSRYVHKGLDGRPVAVIRIYQTHATGPGDVDDSSGAETRRLAHKLRNLLTAILLNTELAARQGGGRGPLDALSLIRSAVAGCVDLLDEMQRSPPT